MIPATTVSLREKIQAWRSNKQRRRMPEELWEEAISLAREYGVHPVSKNADVSYARLKRLVDGEPPMRMPSFAELSPARNGAGA